MTSIVPDNNYDRQAATERYLEGIGYVDRKHGSAEDLYLDEARKNKDVIADAAKEIQKNLGNEESVKDQQDLANKLMEGLPSSGSFRSFSRTSNYTRI